VRYACPQACFTEHLAAWIKARQNGVTDAPEPMAYGHCMFSAPHTYGCVAYGDTSEKSRRAAVEAHVRGLLHGWDRGLTKEQLDKIVKATVEAEINGISLGAAPYLACLFV